jgi:hypothetical protein
MANIYFPLKQNLVIPSSGDLQGAFFLFPAGVHGLTYLFFADPRTKKVTITLQVYLIATNEIIWQLGSWTISEEGFEVVDPVTSETTKINKYSEVISFFNGDGTLTDAGIAWAKSTPFKGALIGDYV